MGMKQVLRQAFPQWELRDLMAFLPHLKSGRSKGSLLWQDSPHLKLMISRSSAVLFSIPPPVARK